MRPITMGSRQLSRTVTVCLLVLFMSKRDERKARALHSDVSETDSVSDELDGPSDTKSNISVVQMAAVQ